MNNKITLSLLAPILLSAFAVADATSDAMEAALKTTDVESKFAAKSVGAKSEGLQQSINFGFANTTGNAETLNANGKYAMGYTTVGYNQKALTVGFDTSAFITKNENITDNEEYTANLGVEQYVTDSGWLGYASMNWFRNEFRNFDNKFSIGTGAGKELYNDGQHSFKAKLGVAYNIEQYSNGQPEHKFTSLNEYLEYNNNLNKVSNLYARVGSSQNFEDFNDADVLGVVGFNFAVAENLSVIIEEEARYDNLPPIGFEKTDTKSIVRVGYNF